MRLQLKIFSKLKLNKQVLLLVSLVLLYCQNILSQNNPTQISNIFKGKLVGLAYNDGAKTFPTEKLINFNCSSCTTVGNAYLFCVEINAGDDPNSTIIGNYKVNDIDYLFNNSTRVGIRKDVNTNNVPAFIHFQQIKFNCSNQNFIKFNIPDQDSQHAFLGFFLVFECLDANSQEVSYSLKCIS